MPSRPVECARDEARGAVEFGFCCETWTSNLLQQRVNKEMGAAAVALLRRPSRAEPVCTLLACLVVEDLTRYLGIRIVSCRGC